jgi:hypothetical protein
LPAYFLSLLCWVMRKLHNGSTKAEFHLNPEENHAFQINYCLC